MATWWQWGLLALVPPAIFALYFLKLRRRPVEVPSTYLWQRAIEDLRVNSLWQRLRNSLLLLLQLLVIALVMLALGRPTWRASKRLGERTVFLIDTSASMAAVDVRPSRLEEAKRRVLEQIKGMRSADVAMVISFSDAARVEQPYTSNRAALRKAVRAVRQTEATTDLSEALKLASGLANPSKTGDLVDSQVTEAAPAEVYIYSDGRFADVNGFALGNLKPVFVQMGTKTAENVGIVALSTSGREDEHGTLQVFSRLINAGAENRRLTVELYRDGSLTDADQIELPAGESRGLVFELEPFDSGVLELRVDTTDDLKLDDRAWLAINPLGRTTVLCVTPGNRPLERALTTARAERRADVVFVEPSYLETEEYRRLAGEGKFDLIIYDRCRPGDAPQANTFFIARAPGWRGWSVGKPVIGPDILDTEQAHPLLQWVQLRDVLFAEATPLKPPKAASRLIESNFGTLMAIAPRENFQDLVLGVELFGEKEIATNWTIKPSFPVLVLNLLEYLGGDWSNPGATQIRPGQSVTLPVGGSTRLSVVTPSGKTVPVARGRLTDVQFRRTGEQGVYQWREGGRLARRFAVNLSSPRESDLRVRPEGALQIGNVTVAATVTQTTRRELWKLLLIVALVVLVAEWIVYRYRIDPRVPRPRFEPRLSPPPNIGRLT